MISCRRPKKTCRSYQPAIFPGFSITIPQVLPIARKKMRRFCQSENIYGMTVATKAFILVGSTTLLVLYMTPTENKPKKKICTLCYGTGFVSNPNGVKVPCPKGCTGIYSNNHR
jgi:hypothetical protein